MTTTHFASPERSSNDQVIHSQQSIIIQTLLVQVLNAYPEIVVILDKNRQIIFCNTKLLESLEVSDMTKIIGKRPGEIFGCIHADKEPAGCGTSVFCRECGAANAIVSAQENGNIIKECRMTITTGEGEKALDLRVWAAPIVICDERYTIFTIVDIGDEKRREALEHTFFHDILNEVALISGFSENAKDGLLELNQSLMENIYAFSQKMIMTIKAHRDLLAAEKGELVLSQEEISIKEAIDELIRFFTNNPLAQGKKIHCTNDKRFTLTTDKTLLRRVLVNLIKNALEAINEGQIVTIDYALQNDHYLFSVNTPLYMPEHIQHQIYQRSFSTKGKGRGLGTYSVKLFTEQYLDGKTWFASTKEEGTTFYVSLPAYK